MPTAPPRSPWYGPPAWLQPLLVLPSLVSLGGLVLAAPPAANLPDPTRPPPALQVANAARGMAARMPPSVDGYNPQAAAPQTPPGMGGTAAMNNSPAEAAAPTGGLVLQAVQVPNRGPATAMLDGRLVKVGDTIGGLQVTSIDNQGVTLKGGSGNQRLSLLGRDSKQPAGSIVISRSASYSPGNGGAGAAPTAPVRNDTPNEQGAGRTAPQPSSAGNGDTPTAAAPDQPMAVAGKSRP